MPSAHVHTRWLRASRQGEAFEAKWAYRASLEVDMFAEMTGLPGAVIGFKASGTVHAEDYRDVLLPAIERAASAGPVRVVLVFEDFEGLSAGALWQDLRVGVE